MEIYFEISEYFEIYFILFEINENLLLKSDIKIKYDEMNEIIIPEFKFLILYPHIKSSKSISNNLERNQIIISKIKWNEVISRFTNYEN